YVLIAGERRLRAATLNGDTTIKAHIIDAQEHKLRELALIENIQRDDLNIIELAYSYAHLINEHTLTHEELSQRIFKSRASITNTLRLLTLSVYVQQLLGNDKITAGHAKVLIGLDDDIQKLVADSILGQKLSVRETEQLVKQYKDDAKKRAGKKSAKKQQNYDFSSLDPVISSLKSSQFDVKAEKNYLKIQINSQEDIDKLLKHFNLS
ncbi:MAG: ParB/RepB/Spo0J family partition protein, partial [Campylobacterota bacterium]|nr:ParB/RepB/Spo0J family partition protein [Campylobacterota bacterium]